MSAKKGSSIKKAAQKKQLKKSTHSNNYSEKNKFRLFILLKDQICITVGPWLMKLYITPPSILTLVTWVPQIRLAFCHHRRVS